MFPRLLVVVLCLLPCCLWAQNPTGMISPPDSIMKYRDTTGQRDLIGIAFRVSHIHPKKPTVDGRRVYYSLIPLSTSVPGGGTALVTATTAGFYLGPRRSTYLSNITFSPSTNFIGEFNFPFHSNIWSKGNTWNYSGDTRFTIFPLYTWGLGGDGPESHKLLIRYSYLRLYQNALKRIKPYLFAGLGYNMDYRINIRAIPDTIDFSKFAGYNYGTANHSNSFSSGVTFNLLYDSRNNPINPLPGFYGNIVFRVNPRFLGSDDQWESLYLDFRKYISFQDNEQNVLAIWTYFWTAIGNKTPYLDLPSIGWDANQRSGRGIYTGRYAGQSLYYLETEYRRDISADGLFGFVVFSNVNTVTEPGTNRFSYLHPAAGAGLRVKFNKHSGTNVAIDLARSKERTEFYLNLGEAF
jgi:surface antigen Omp85-like protein